MYLSNYAETAFLNTMRGQSFAAPSQLFVGLFLSSPTDTGVGGIEIIYSGYARMPIVFGPPIVEGTGIGVRNTEQITFAKSPIDAGTVRHIGIYDSVTGGNMYLYGELTEEMPIMTGEEPVLLINEVLFFSIGDLTTAYKTKLFNVMRGITLPGFTPHCSLWNGNPEVGGSELAGENYSRVPLTFSAPSEDISGMALIRNSITVNFNRPTTNWGNWNFTVLFDALTGGIPVWAQSRAPKNLIRGVMPIVSAEATTIGIN